MSKESTTSYRAVLARRFGDATERITNRNDLDEGRAAAERLAKDRRCDVAGKRGDRAFVAALGRRPRGGVRGRAV
jgi:hypothetical protein